MAVPALRIDPGEFQLRLLGSVRKGAGWEAGGFPEEYVPWEAIDSPEEDLRWELALSAELPAAPGKTGAGNLPQFPRLEHG